jgi:cytochrome c oxidase subunit 3
VDKDRVALAEFATTLPEERQLNKQVNGFMDEPSLPSYSVAEVQAGFKGIQNF